MGRTYADCRPVQKQLLVVGDCITYTQLTAVKKDGGDASSRPVPVLRCPYHPANIHTFKSPKHVEHSALYIPLILLMRSKSKYSYTTDFTY